jgi:hypothetical protein
VLTILIIEALRTRSTVSVNPPRWLLCFFNRKSVPGKKKEKPPHTRKEKNNTKTAPHKHMHM